MFSFPVFLTNALNIASALRYPLIFIGAIVEGPILMVACGFFLRFGTLTFVPTYVVLVVGDLAADIAWYYVGYYFAEPLMHKHGKFFSITPEVFEKVKGLVSRYQNSILLVSKLTVGFGLALATLIVAGSTRMSIRKYIVLNGIGEALLVLILLALGYFLGQFYTSIAHGFRDVFIAAAFIVIAGAIYGFTRYSRRKALEW